MGYATILGLDLGKFKSVCCVMDAATGGRGFETVDTTPAAVKALLVKRAPAGTGGVSPRAERLLTPGGIHSRRVSRPAVPPRSRWPQVRPAPSRWA